MRHAGLDPASSAFLDSRLRGNDSLNIFKIAVVIAKLRHSEYAFLTTWIAYEKALFASSSTFSTMDKANFACVNNDLKVYIKVLDKDNHLHSLDSNEFKCI